MSTFSLDHCPQSKWPSLYGVLLFPPRKNSSRDSPNYCTIQTEYVNIFISQSFIWCKWIDWLPWKCICGQVFSSKGLLECTTRTYTSELPDCEIDAGTLLACIQGMWIICTVFAGGRTSRQQAEFLYVSSFVKFICMYLNNVSDSCEVTAIWI